MAFKTKFDIEFAVISDKVVVCYATPLNDDPKISELEAVYDYLYDDAPYPREPANSFKGVAVRKEGDDNDIETAKEIARKKALRAAYRAHYNYAYSLLDKIFQYWERGLDITDVLADKANIMTAEIKALAAGGSSEWED